MKKHFAASMFLAISCGMSVASAQLSAPQLNSPVNNAANVAITNGYVDIQWLWVAGASYMMVYQAQISTDANFASPIVCDSTFRHMPHVIGAQTTNLANNTTYFWRVRASDTAAGSQWSPWSEVWKFTTAATTPIEHGRSEDLSAAAHRVEISLAGSNLCILNAKAGSVVSVFDMAGRLLQTSTLLSGEQAIALPSSTGVLGKPLVVRIRSAGTTLRNVVVMP